MEALIKVRRFVSFRTLKERGVVRSRKTLRRWQRNSGFPDEYEFGPRSNLFDESEINEWIDSQRARSRQPLRRVKLDQGKIVSRSS